MLVLALAAAALVAGCGSSSTTPSTSAVPPVKTSTVKTRNSLVPAHHARPKHAAPVSKRAPVKKSAPKKPAPKKVVVPKRQVIKAGAELASYSGTGDAALATLSETKTVVLEWKSSTPPIQIFNKHGFVLVNSSSATGEVRLARGKYTGLRVATKGAWTLEIRASA